MLLIPLNLNPVPLSYLLITKQHSLSRYLSSFADNLLSDYLLQTSFKMVLSEYTYVFAIGTFFALLDAFNNGASK